MLITMTKHNTLYDIQNKQLQVPKVKRYKKLLFTADKLKHIDFQTMLIEEEVPIQSPLRVNDEDD